MSDAAMKKKSSIRDVIITQSIAILAFVGVPILITLMASLTDIEFSRDESGPRVDVTRYVLMYIPWKSEHATNVTEIRASITPAKHYQGTAEERRKGQKGVRLSTAHLAIVGEGLRFTSISILS